MGLFDFFGYVLQKLIHWVIFCIMWMLNTFSFIGQGIYLSVLLLQNSF